jgi:23S rRNA (guanosine2251-2'-O)-methyltransferase
MPQKLFLAHRAEGSIIREITQLADSVGLPVERMSALELSRISKQGKQDQGVALDVQAPHYQSLNEALELFGDRLKSGAQLRPIFLLDGVQTPANLGMILRSLCAAGVEGVILPRRGCAPLNPLAVKASAGVALKAPVWSCETALEAAEALRALGLSLFGLRGEEARCLYTELTEASGVWVLGNESEGVSAEVSAQITAWASIPMTGGVESLNAAVAASVVAFELTRRSLLKA